MTRDVATFIYEFIKKEIWDLELGMLWDLELGMLWDYFSVEL